MFLSNPKKKIEGERKHRKAKIEKKTRDNKVTKLAGK